MSKRVLLFSLLSIFYGTLLAQDSLSVQWASKVIAFSSAYITNPPSNQFSANQILGKPNKLPAVGSSACAWSPAYEDNRADEWIKVGFANPLPIRQVAIAESYHAGTISQVFLYDEKDKEYLIFKNLDTKSADSSGRMLHIFFPLTLYKVSAVKIVLNICDVKGWNHIDAIGISNSSESIEAKINLAYQHDYQGEIENLGDSINSDFDEIMPVIAPDGQLIFIDRKNHPENIGNEANDDIWYATLQENHQWTSAKHLPSPLNNDSHNYVCTITPDGNTLLLANRYIKDGKSLGGVSISHRINTLDEWSFPQEIKIDNYYNLNKFAEYFLANNRKSLLLAIQRNDSHGDRDLYVSFSKPDGTWSTPLNLGENINTAGIELTPFLAADDRTLYFSSNGFSGYGETDIFMSVRLDDTWTRWSEPVNLGNFLNSKDWDASCTIDAKGEYVYFVSYNNTHSKSADIFKAKLPQEVRPKPVVLISGKVLNSKTKEPIHADIVYEILKTGIEAGYAKANFTTGEYKIILPAQETYGFWAKAKGFFPVSEHIDLSIVAEYQELNKDLLLTPIEIGQSIVLNNIFFEQGTATLLSPSYPEMDRVVLILKENPSINISLEGHTDIEGMSAQNMKLSYERVDYIKNFLIDKGIGRVRISVQAFGDTQPITRKRDEESKRLNRRVELRILE
jgi:outer membrane protein OmpA-like peptidoglycan-associated protein